MRIISYDEFVYNKKKDYRYNNKLLPEIKKNKNVLHKLITREVKIPGFFFYNPLDGVDTLEILFYEGYITKNDITNSFKNIEINSLDIYEIIFEYCIAFENRNKDNIFPFNLRIDTSILKKKLINTPKEFVVNDFKFDYEYFYNIKFFKKDYDEIMYERRNSTDINDFRLALLENPILCVLGQKPNRKDYDIHGFTQVSILMDYLQIFIDDGLITNNQINKILSEIDITNLDWFMHVEEYLRIMLRLNKFKWHRYTLDIDVKMLQNKVEGVFYTPITDEGRSIRKEAFINLYNILDSPLKFDKTPQERHELDMFYREKYRKLYEAESKEKANK